VAWEYTLNASPAVTSLLSAFPPLSRPLNGGESRAGLTETLDYKFYMAGGGRCRRSDCSIGNSSRRVNNGGNLLRPATALAHLTALAAPPAVLL
jgi:hypothetical protein